MISISEETAKKLMKVIAQQPMMVARLAQIECGELIAELQKALEVSQEKLENNDKTIPANLEGYKETE